MRVGANKGFPNAANSAVNVIRKNQAKEKKKEKIEKKENQAKEKKRGKSKKKENQRAQIVMTLRNRLERSVGQLTPQLNYFPSIKEAFILS